MKSPLHKWALSLTGWKWWVWQLVVGGIVLAILEYLLNIIVKYLGLLGVLFILSIIFIDANK